MNEFELSKSINDDFWTFVNSNSDESPSELLLKLHGKSFTFDLDLAVVQIEARHKFRRKLPISLQNSRFLFPSLLSGEQATSDILANFHASLASASDRIFDMTAGLCIDSMAFARKCHTVTACDVNPLTCIIGIHNAKAIGIKNLDLKCCDSIEYLKNSTLPHYDIIFTDPSRRDINNRRTYSFADCSPDIIKNHGLIKSHCNRLIIKASPMLDITEIIKELGGTTNIYVLSFKNECKELLIEQDFREKVSDTPIIKAINFTSDDTMQILDFKYNENGVPCRYIEEENIGMMKYLYEPNVSVMKCSHWNILLERFPSLYKAAPNTHLFFSNIIEDNFPGKIIEINELHPASKNNLNRIKGNRYCVVTKNYNIGANELRKRLQLSEDTESQLYVFRAFSQSKPMMIIGKKLYICNK